MFFGGQGKRFDVAVKDARQVRLALLTGLDPSVKMQIADSVWYHDTFPFLPSFLETELQ